MTGVEGVGISTVHPKTDDAYFMARRSPDGDT